MGVELSIQKSSIMDKSNYTHEHSVVRVPKSLRDAYALPLYSFLTFKTSKNTTISLQVAPAHKRDSELNNNVIYVTSNTYEKIDIKKSTLTPINQITLGCDPELFIINNTNKEIINASDFFAKAGEVGNDGHLLELRPIPSIYSKNVFKYIRYLLVKATTNIKQKIPYETSLVGASYYKKKSAGFHIHFGIPPQLLDPSVIKIKTAINQIVKLLDYYIGIPSILLERGDDTIRRSNIMIEYGKPGNYRLSFPTLEYRVPGGLMLAHPILTEGLLSISMVVIKDILSRIKVYTNDFVNLEYLADSNNIRDLYKNTPASKEEIFSIICNPSPAGALKVINNIFKDIENMLTFSEEKYSITNFYNFITTNELTTQNIGINWGIYE